MDRVKFYSSGDLSSGSHLVKAENIINRFDSTKNDYEINEILEFYNITKFIDESVFLKSWTKENIENLKITIKEYKKIIACYFKSISDDNFITLYNQAENIYKDDFFELIEKYKIYEKTSEGVFNDLLNIPKIHLFRILENKNTVDYYGNSIRASLLSNYKYAELILRKYEISNSHTKTTIYFPKIFSNKDKEQLLIDYIEAPDSNLNYLRIIVNIQSTPDLEISDKTRLKCKNRIKKDEKAFFEKSTGISQVTTITFCDNQKETVEFKGDGYNIDFSYDLNWIKNNPDINTLLNNFIYLFGFLDQQMRISLVRKNKDLGIIERELSLGSKKAYITGFAFRTRNTISDLQITAYYKQLEKLEIRLEEVLESFFKEYLLKEFEINDYRVTMPSKDSTYLEKCRTILPEIDGVLKQYSLFLEDGEIDFELLQISSNPLLFKDIKSLITKKYVYSNPGRFDELAFCFFSNQCMLAYVEKIDKNYDSFYELILNEKVKIEDFQIYDKGTIESLIEEGYIKENSEGYIEINNHMHLKIFKDLNDNEVISYWKYPYEYRCEIDKLVKADLLRFENTLFSKPEQDYFNYHLNKSEFNNALDLRNMYSHGTQPNSDSDESTHKKNYMTFLKLFVLIVIKLNDELCILNDDDYKKFTTIIPDEL